MNVAPQQFQDGGLVGTVREALAGRGLAPERLELEITESALLEDGGWGTMGQLRALKAMGVRIAMDDFGTGYSSLGQLRSFPFDRVKIDRSFADDAAVVRAVAAPRRQPGHAHHGRGGGDRGAAASASAPRAAPRRRAICSAGRCRRPSCRR